MCARWHECCLPEPSDKQGNKKVWEARWLEIYQRQTAVGASSRRSVCRNQLHSKLLMQHKVGLPVPHQRCRYGLQRADSAQQKCLISDLKNFISNHLLFATCSDTECNCHFRSEQYLIQLADTAEAIV